MKAEIRAWRGAQSSLKMNPEEATTVVMTNFAKADSRNHDWSKLYGTSDPDDEAEHFQHSFNSLVFPHRLTKAQEKRPKSGSEFSENEPSGGNNRGREILPRRTSGIVTGADQTALLTLMGQRSTSSIRLRVWSFLTSVPIQAQGKRHKSGTEFSENEPQEATTGVMRNFAKADFKNHD